MISQMRSIRLSDSLKDWIWQMFEMHSEFPLILDDNVIQAPSMSTLGDVNNAGWVQYDEKKSWRNIRPHWSRSSNRRSASSALSRPRSSFSVIHRFVFFGPLACSPLALTFVAIEGASEAMKALRMRRSLIRDDRCRKRYISTHAGSQT